jgi:hypothetical protein
MSDSLAAFPDDHRLAVLIDLLDEKHSTVEALFEGADTADAAGSPEAFLAESLPPLVEPGYVSHDADSGLLSRGPEYDTIAPLLELVASNPDALSEYAASEGVPEPETPDGPASESPSAESHEL